LGFALFGGRLSQLVWPWWIECKNDLWQRTANAIFESKIHRSREVRQYWKRRAAYSYEKKGDHSKLKTIHRKRHDAYMGGPVVINCILRGSSNLADRSRHTTVKNWPPELDYLKQEKYPDSAGRVFRRAVNERAKLTSIPGLAPA
jgi:hypothetical protein